MSNENVDKIECPNCTLKQSPDVKACFNCGYRFSFTSELPALKTMEPKPIVENVKGILAGSELRATSEQDHWQSSYVRLTYGSKFYLKNPSLSKCVRLVDLLVPIAEMSRYNFHLPMHYSVAEHCYYCSQRCSIPLYGLLHDLAEAIIGDLPSPIKVLCPDYKRVELRVEKWIYSVFGLDPHKIPIDLKKVDKRILTSEQLHFGRKADSIDAYPPYLDLKIGCWKSTYAVLKFFERLQELTNGKYTLDTILEMPEQPDTYFEPQTGTPSNV